MSPQAVRLRFLRGGGGSCPKITMQIKNPSFSRAQGSCRNFESLCKASLFNMRSQHHAVARAHRHSKFLGLISPVFSHFAIFYSNRRSGLIPDSRGAPRNYQKTGPLRPAVKGHIGTRTFSSITFLGVGALIADAQPLGYHFL